MEIIDIFFSKKRCQEEAANIKLEDGSQTD